VQQQTQPTAAAKAPPEEQAEIIDDRALRFEHPVFDMSAVQPIEPHISR